VRRYRARAHGRTTQEKLDTLKDGVTVEGVRYGPIEAKLDKAKEGPQGANLWITVTLHEGKNREVRRVLESIGLKVNRLIRLAYGPLALGTLGVGELEEVGPRVIREQFAAYIDADNLPKGERPQYRAKSKASRREPCAAAPAPEPAREPKAKKAYKPGWAKPKPKVRAYPPPKKGAAKPSGSPRAGDPSAGPRGPKPSASPRRTSGARRPGPPRSGGRGPRG
jgi:23S rRNA pseudouridine2605 synthase